MVGKRISRNFKKLSKRNKMVDSRLYQEEEKENECLYCGSECEHTFCDKECKKAYECDN